MGHVPVLRRQRASRAGGRTAVAPRGERQGHRRAAGWQCPGARRRRRPDVADVGDGEGRVGRRWHRGPAGDPSSRPAPAGRPDLVGSDPSRRGVVLGRPGDGTIRAHRPIDGGRARPNERTRRRRGRGAVGRARPGHDGGARRRVGTGRSVRTRPGRRDVRARGRGLGGSTRVVSRRGVIGAGVLLGDGRPDAGAPRRVPGATPLARELGWIDVERRRHRPHRRPSPGSDSRRSRVARRIVERECRPRSGVAVR